MELAGWIDDLTLVCLTVNFAGMELPLAHTAVCRTLQASGTAFSLRQTHYPEPRDACLFHARLLLCTSVRGRGGLLGTMQRRTPRCLSRVLCTAQPDARNRNVLDTMVQAMPHWVHRVLRDPDPPVIGWTGTLFVCLS